MESGVKIALIVSAAIILVALIGAYAFYQVIPHPYNGNTISVNGNSVIKVTPDIVTVYFNVETNGTTAKEAKDANSLVTDNLITALVKEGFERKDIQTQSFNIYEDIRWENNKQKSYGYKASNQIKVELSTAQADKIGEVIDAGVDAGALLQWINFELSSVKQNEYKAQALKEAGQDAKTKATAIAEGLDKRLGDIVSISTSDWGYQPWNLYTANAGGMREDAVMAKQATTSIQPGTQEVSGYVSVVYELK
jgi:uncharacterized protein YggE